MGKGRHENDEPIYWNSICYKYLNDSLFTRRTGTTDSTGFTTGICIVSIKNNNNNIFHRYNINVNSEYEIRNKEYIIRYPNRNRILLRAINTYLYGWIDTLRVVLYRAIVDLLDYLHQAISNSLRVPRFAILCSYFL